MFLSLGFGKNTIDSKYESKRKVVILETRNGNLSEQVSDILASANIMCLTRMDNKMYRGKRIVTIYRTYVSDTMFKRARTLLMNCALNMSDAQIIEG